MEILHFIVLFTEYNSNSPAQEYNFLFSIHRSWYHGIPSIFTLPKTFILFRMPAPNRDIKYWDWRWKEKKIPLRFTLMFIESIYGRGKRHLIIEDQLLNYQQRKAKRKKIGFIFIHCISSKFWTGIMLCKNVQWTVHKGVVMRSNDIDNITDRHNNTNRSNRSRHGHHPTTTNVFCTLSFRNISSFQKIFCFSGKVFASQ